MPSGGAMIQTRKNSHFTNWDTITKPKNQGGLGIKKFGLMNKALISKQYWRICNNPNSLLTKTLKSKYCPYEDIHTHKPKQHSSWMWRTIMVLKIKLNSNPQQKIFLKQQQTDNNRINRSLVSLCIYLNTYCTYHYFVNINILIP